MNDNEVGEIWRWVQSGIPDDADVAMDTQAKMEKLIRKLVKERMGCWELIVAKYGIAEGLTTELLALHDFGIRPEDWKEQD